MKILPLLAVLAIAAVPAAGCVTVFDGGGNGSNYGWTGQSAQPLDDAKAACRAAYGRSEGTTAFISCMAERGWTRVAN